jgi:hypothetical protein
MRLQPEKQACPRRENPTASKTGLRLRQTERGGKGSWDAEQFDRHLVRGWDAHVPSEPLCPEEASMGSLRTGQDDIRGAWRSGCGWQQAHLDTLEPHELHTSAPVFSAAPISRSRSGAEPTGSGCSSTLTWRGFLVALPCHWHCSRTAQGRQLRMLAPYTTRRLPSASRRCSCGINFSFAGQRSVPSGWRAKSWPEKRPAFQGKPT